mmetsp:Transcript_65278/g.155997  ORF Transcript_65278/g.155997 Transcript_65278/m.155997 type:complete len:812 (-) Transcript_65278:70-2505(-)
MESSERKADSTDDGHPRVSIDGGGSIGSPPSVHHAQTHFMQNSFEDRIAIILSNAARAVENEHRLFLEKQRLYFQSKIANMSQWGDRDSVRSFEVSIGVDRQGVQWPTSPRGYFTTHGSDILLYDSEAERQGSEVPPSVAPSSVCGEEVHSYGFGTTAYTCASNGGSPIAVHETSTTHHAMSIAHSATSHGPWRTLMHGTSSMMPMADGKPKRSGVYFRLLDDWLEPADEFGEYDKAQLAQIRYYAGLSRFMRGYESYGSANRGPSPMPFYRPPFFMMDPHNHFRIMWDLLAALMLSYDLCMIPMAVFDMPSDGIVFIMSVIIMFYWTLDIILNFSVGYHKTDGDIEMHVWPVVKRYASTWLVPDVVIVSLDWVSYGGALFAGQSGSEQSAGGLVRVGKITRFVRVMRVLRLLRFGKLRQLMQRVHDNIGMESTAILFSICKNLTVIILINHGLATIWYWLGLQDEETGWLYDRKDADWYDNYLMAMHWSIANFTPGSSAIQPRNTMEYVFHIFVLFFAMVVFSVFVSSTTSQITKLMGLQSTRSKQMWILKGFLLQHNFPPELRDRVLRYVKAALGNRRDLIHRADVDLLTMLSQPLREEVQMNLHMATLRAHPLIKLLALANPQMMRKFGAEALLETAFSRDDNIFSAGEHVDKMSFVVAGVLSYDFTTQTANVVEGGLAGRPSDKSLNPSDMERRLLGPQDFFCEAPLWTRWTCRGTMTADADCDLIDIQGVQFRRAIKRHPLMMNLARQYAAAFVEVLNYYSAGDGDGPLTDLHAPFVQEEPICKVLSEPQFIERKNSAGLLSLVRV